MPIHLWESLETWFKVLECRIVLLQLLKQYWGFFNCLGCNAHNFFLQYTRILCDILYACGLGIVHLDSMLGITAPWRTHDPTSFLTVAIIACLANCSKTFKHFDLNNGYKTYFLVKWKSLIQNSSEIRGYFIYNSWPEELLHQHTNCPKPTHVWKNTYKTIIFFSKSV